MINHSISAYAQINPGLELILLNELLNKNLNPQIDSGGAYFNCSLKDLYYLNLTLKTPTRIIVRIAEFTELTLNKLQKRFLDLPWDTYIPQNTTKIRLRTSSHKSKIYHTGAINERLLNSLSKHLGKKISIDNNDEVAPLIIIRVLHNKFTISVDSSGQPLYKRGYKKHVSKAPLRENIASSIIQNSGWQANLPLIDPFCGSGTIPIEAFLYAKNISLYNLREFQFMKWKNFNEDLYKEVLKKVEEEINTTNVKIYAYDVDELSLRAFKENLKFIPYNQEIIVSRKNYKEIEPSFNTGYIITNPPYGLRLKTKQSVEKLYLNMIDTFIKKFPGWKLCLLVPYEKLQIIEKKIIYENLLSFVHGGIRLNFIRINLN